MGKAWGNYKITEQIYCGKLLQRKGIKELRCTSLWAGQDPISTQGLVSPIPSNQGTEHAALAEHNSKMREWQERRYSQVSTATRILLATS